VCYFDGSHKKENMKKIFLLTLFVFSNCNSQNTTLTKEKIKISKYKNYELHPGVLDNPKRNSHFYLHNNKEIQIYQDDKIISVQENIKDSPFKSQKLFSKKTHILTREQTQFYNFCIGITKIYDENGKLTRTINCDEKYSFTINQLIEKLKKDYKIDFSNRKGNGRRIERNYINGKDCYNVIINLGTSAKSGTKNIIIDGNNGEVISESNHQYNEEKDERI
jgi:hypothetical protein